MPASMEMSRRRLNGIALVRTQLAAVFAFPVFHEQAINVRRFHGFDRVHKRPRFFERKPKRKIILGANYHIRNILRLLDFRA